ncbi:MAG: sugar transferase [Sphingorhabdus sp.]
MTFASSSFIQNPVGNEKPEIYDQDYSSHAPDTDPVAIVQKPFPAVAWQSTPHHKVIVANDVMMRSWLTRFIDIILAATALIVLFPVLMLICFAIWFQDRGLPIFAHRRIGKAGKSFPCLKFRTMVTDADKRLADILQSDPEAAEEWRLNQKLRVDPRITPIGNLLRKTSLDELPQLFNVLIGQMSLVGPRPIVEGEIPHYGRYFAHYCRVRPGITGLWQVSGRSDVSYRRRVVLDTVYCRSKSFMLDFSILTRTVPAVLMRKGAA